MGPTGTDTVTRADIEATLQAIRGEVDSALDEAKVPAAAVGALAVAGLVGGAFVLGKRRGRKTTTFVEVRRV